jgi:hypothetical protein
MADYLAKTQPHEIVKSPGDLPAEVAPNFKVEWGVKSSQRWFAKGKTKILDSKVSKTCQDQQLSNASEKLQI